MRLIHALSVLSLKLSPWFGSSHSMVDREQGVPHDVKDFARLPEHMSKYVEEVRTELGVPSIGIAVVKRVNDDDGHGSWESAIGTFGTANVQGDPVTKDSLFAIASNTKFFTALSVGMLIENGTKLPSGEPLKWDTKIKVIFPGIQFPEPSQTDLLNVIDLMSMHSGMPRHDYGFYNSDYKEIINALPHLRASAEIRQAYQYCNIGFVILSGIIPELTGTPFHEFVQQHFFDPLDMTSSYLKATVASATGKWTDSALRIGINKPECRKQWTENRKLDASCLGQVHRFGPWTDTDYLEMGGAGGAILSLVDMTKWIKELLDPQVVPADLIKKAGHPYTPITDPTWPELGAESYGLGQISFSFRGHQVVTHSGGLPGATSLLLRLVNDDYGIMIATNEGDLSMSVLYGLGHRFLEDHLGLEPIDWVERYTDQWVNRKNENQVIAPKHPKPSPSRKEVEGMYEHPVYGSFDIRAVEPLSVSMDSLDSNVQALITEQFSDHLEGIYFAHVRMIFANYIVFTRVSGNVFSWTALDLYPTLNEDRSKSKVFGNALAPATGSAFISSKGIGMFGNFWGAGDAVPVEKAEEDMDYVEKRAEVWFKKVE
ncbi:beta-lactamase/transpeptidase-like protein [Kockovaella imperatae]|uniref:Beta-lactamase/transpeptidase-like protein n=1 Tax=Kockovaella imperatae TaxID=4999 RepID=A0A1Y1UGL3_9TREE|nr:beta-lactamase/transpeptidase-like protein [Kockovaella imperatae]ORX36667.1 beta-lactamase/transpeptidase-like protein [Kockovaella imperatae]